MLTKHFLPLLLKNRGTVVNVTSGLVYAPLVIQPNYSALKAALHSMTQSMRWMLSGKGIRVVEIFYPAVDTPFQEGHAPKNAMKPRKAAAIALRGLNRGKEEIRVGLSNPIYYINRLLPRMAIRLVNGQIPDNVEDLLRGS